MNVHFCCEIILIIITQIIRGVLSYKRNFCSAMCELITVEISQLLSYVFITFSAAGKNLARDREWVREREGVRPHPRLSRTTLLRTRPGLAQREREVTVSVLKTKWVFAGWCQLSCSHDTAETRVDVLGEGDSYVMSTLLTFPSLTLSPSLYLTFTPCLTHSLTHTLSLSLTLKPGVDCPRHSPLTSEIFRIFHDICNSVYRPGFWAWAPGQKWRIFAMFTERRFRHCY